MCRQLMITLLIAAFVLATKGQCPNGYDTLYTRSETYLLVPKYDTLKQLEVANMKADSLLLDLKEILCKLQKDTCK